MVGCSGSSGSAATGSSSSVPTQTAPSIVNLSQTSAAQGGAAFSLTVTGQNFLSTSTVEWNDAPLTTTYTSSTQLVANVPASNIASAGTAHVVVEDAEPQPLVSNSVAFSITPVVQAAPVLSSISSTTATVGSAGFALTATGQNFLPTSVMQFNGVTLTTVVNSSTQLVATVPAANLVATGTASITVVDPSPLSLTSNALNFSITSIPPTISQINPSTAIVNTGPLTLNILGQNFSSGATVAFGTTGLAITAQSTSQIQATLPASLLTATGTFPVTISNPAPNAAVSTPFMFTVQPVPVATITSLNPSSVVAGATAVSLQIVGQAFV
jgi:hypothetical protein